MDTAHFREQQEWRRLQEVTERANIIVTNLVEIILLFFHNKNKKKVVSVLFLDRYYSTLSKQH